MVIAESSHGFALGLLAAVVGCGGPAGRSAGQPLSASDIAAWSGPRAAAPAAAEAAAPPPSSIELAGGDHLRAFVALVQFEGGPQPVCALYALRASGAVLEEGRRSIDCPADGLGALDADDVRHRPVEEPRLAQLRSALAGARPVPAGGSPPDAVEAIRVRVVTDRTTVEGLAAPAAWPSPVETEPDPTYARAPANLTEFYEAVMYPTRYAR